MKVGYPRSPLPNPFSPLISAPLTLTPYIQTLVTSTVLLAKLLNPLLCVGFVYSTTNSKPDFMAGCLLCV